jgi:methyl coenzyme M reductase gamma subunit
MLERDEINSSGAETDTKHYLEHYVALQQPNENIDDEIKNIKEMIDLYDDNYDGYRRRYLQTQS